MLLYFCCFQKFFFAYKNFSDCAFHIYVQLRVLLWFWSFVVFLGDEGLCSMGLWVLNFLQHALLESSFQKPWGLEESRKMTMASYFVTALYHHWLYLPVQILCQYDISILELRKTMHTIWDFTVTSEICGISSKKSLDYNKHHF